MPKPDPTEHDLYVSPLVTRNASRRMSSIFGPTHRIKTWRRLWIALAESQKKLGLDISTRQIQQLKKAADTIDFIAAARYEKDLRHDVMAHLHAFADGAPAAKPILHLGATSAYIVDNADLIIMRDALILIRDWLVNAIDRLAKFAKKYKSLPTLGFTHYQPAQLTTVGKRASLWCYDFVRDLEEIQYRIDTLPFRGVKGTTGTQASFVELFQGNTAKIDRLDASVAKAFDFKSTEPVTGQTCTRKVDAQAVSSLAQIAASVHKFANDIRLLANLKEIEEPFEAKQVGSSAMAYKRNPMRCERATGLARFVISLSTSPLQTAAEQWLERSLDDSSNKRLVIPESFLAAEGMLKIVTNVAEGLVVYPKVIAARIDAELPFMATENIIMAGVNAGGDRQDLHEAVRHHSHEAGRQVKEYGNPNDLLARLSSDPLFANVDIRSTLNPKQYTGRAAEQVDNFLTQCITPIRRKHRKSLGMKADLHV